MSKKHTRKAAPYYPPSWYDPTFRYLFPNLRPFRRLITREGK